jgi:hypothetical protein
MAGKKESVNGIYCLQRAYWQDCGIASRDKNTEN